MITVENIRSKNEYIQKMIAVITEAMEKEDSKQEPEIRKKHVKIMEKILTAEQKKCAAIYLAMFPEFTDIDLFEQLGNVIISKNCSSGINYDEKAILIHDDSKTISALQRQDGYGSGTSMTLDDVINQKGYEKYMLLSGGTELGLYLSTLPHEVRHLMGIDGNSKFAQAKGFAEGKNELDSRRAAEMFGLTYFPNRNYSYEVLFVKSLENLFGKEEIDRLGSFRTVEYKRLEKEFGQEFREYVELRNQNSNKKKINLLREKEGLGSLKKDTDLFNELVVKYKAENEEKEKEFRKAVGSEKYLQIKVAYEKVEQDRAKTWQELYDKMPEELKKYVKIFDIIHLSQGNRDEMAQMMEDKLGGNNSDSLFKYAGVDGLEKRVVPEVQEFSVKSLERIINVQIDETEILQEVIRELAPDAIINEASIKKMATQKDVAKKYIDATEINSRMTGEVIQEPKENITERS